MAVGPGCLAGKLASRVGADAAPILAFDGVAKRYGTLQALAGVSFQVNRGEVVCLDVYKRQLHIRLPDKCLRHSALRHVSNCSMTPQLFRSYLLVSVGL